MNKEQMARKFWKETGCSLYKAREYIDVMVKIILDALAEGDTVVLRDFGTFSLTERKESVRKDIRTKDWRVVPKRKYVKFRASRLVNKGFNTEELDETEDMEE